MTKSILHDKMIQIKRQRKEEYIENADTESFHMVKGNEADPIEDGLGVA